ncbi:hypothetical protein GYH30_035033 [Glycine max]|uniref:RNA helicase n=2 Tax=Glycine subgen. Soja TaxID=1462606 RepID=K7LY14_SOYBN|nr:hypothetical protein GYH30_035033 [Glycine max]
MDLNQESEIRRVHLGVAVLRILALGVKDVLGFDFVDAPSPSSIDMAIKNLIQLRAIELNYDVHDLTSEGWCLVRMGIEPRLGKLILGCFKHGLGKEGIILATVMANASSIFCRVGSEFDKQRFDGLKVQFCHCDGDLFTLLSVYKEWEALPRERKNKWCWENNINAKSMRSYWRWDTCMPSNHDKNLKRVILSSPAENVAMYSGCFIEVNVDNNEIHLYASSNYMDIALGLVNDVLE